MNKYLLVAINSQYIHTNLAVRYLKKYVEKYSDKKLEIYETNINNHLPNIIKDIFEKKSEIIIFSTYIWNRDYVFKIIKELKKILPNSKVGMGGPEVTYDSIDILKSYQEVDFLIKGEGENSLLKIVSENVNKLKGIYEVEGPNNLDEIPFPYTVEELMIERKILYYESTRGCPFSCSYCLSSIERGIKYLSLKRVKEDLDIILKSNIKLLKFVDRTFNINKGRYFEIWNYLIDNYREGITFHFEINANIFDDETLDLLKKVPENYFQFEIGIQSINLETMESINRRNLISKLTENIKKIPKAIHLHLDLIAGLPYETYELFENSFNYVYNLKPEMVQLGFLKVLQGTKISKEIEKYNYKYTDFTPYEVISNNSISFQEISKLKEVERLLNLYYNSGKAIKSIDYIIKNNYISSFKFYEDLSYYFKKLLLLDIGHKESSLFNYLLDFYKYKKFKKIEKFIEYLKYDFLMLGKPGNYPQWFQSKKNGDMYNDIIKTKNFISTREAHKNTELENFSIDILNDTEKDVILFFNYKNNTVEKIKYDIK
ncbi:MAG: DUF4080 domain-containing protein [Fusobacteriaceae bacterium]